MQQVLQLRQQLKTCQDRSNRLSWANDELRKELWGQNHRINNLAIAFGFKDASDAEAAIASGELRDRPCRCLSCPGSLSQTEEHKMHIAGLQHELKQLQDRYDALLDVKERAAARYKRDYITWKNFKDWLFEDNKRAWHFVKKEKAKHKKSKALKEAEKGAHDVEALDAPSTTLVNPPGLEHNHLDTLDNLSDASSVTEDDSQAPLPTSSFDINAYLRSEIAKSSKKRRRASEIPAASSSTSVASRRKSSPKKRRTPRSSPSKHRLESKVLLQEKENTPSHLKTAESSTHVSLIPEQQTRSSLNVKGKARASLTDADTTINALFEINPELNDGVAYAYNSVVRNKNQRKHLDGGDCECCRGYYEGIGPLPPRLAPPLWSDKPPSPSAHHSHSPFAQTDPTTPTRHRNAISKHRAQWVAPKTPPGYWDIGFPDTQEAAAINERARGMQKDKMREVEEEARREGGRWKRRRT